MPAVSRDKVDLATTGHGCTAVVHCYASAKTVFANDIEVLRPGDATAPHVIRKGKKCVGHPAQVNAGSRTVFAEGLPISRVGDSTDRGALIQGSRNVFAG